MQEKMKMGNKEQALVVVSDLVSVVKGDKFAEKKIEQNPEATAIALQQNRESGVLTIAGQSKVFEAMLSGFGDVDTAREFLEGNLFDEYVAELTAHRSDLPSVMDTIGTPKQLVAAIIHDLIEQMVDQKMRSDVEQLRFENLDFSDEFDGEQISEEIASKEKTQGDLEKFLARVESQDATDEKSPKYDQVYFCFILRAWADKLKDRDDWDEFLNFEFDDLTLQDRLLIAIWYEYGMPEDLEQIEAYDFAEFGIEPMEAYTRLETLLEEDDFVDIDPDRLAITQREIVKAKKKKAEMPDLQERIEKQADDLDSL